MGKSAQFTPFYVVYNGESYGCTGVSGVVVMAAATTPQQPYTSIAGTWIAGSRRSCSAALRTRLQKKKRTYRTVAAAICGRIAVVPLKSQLKQALC